MGDSSRTTGVPAATIESLNKRMQGLSLCNADLLRQLADKEKQLQRLMKTMNTQDQELDAARLEIARLKEQQGGDSSVKSDESENPESTVPLPRSTATNNEATTSTSDNHLIISLQKQLE